MMINILDYKSITLFRALKGYDGKTLDQSLSGIKNTELRNKIIQDLKDIIKEQKVIQIAEDNLRISKKNADMTISQLTKSIPEDIWGYFIKSAQVHFKPILDKTSLICQLIQSYFGEKDRYRFFESQIREWNQLYKIDCQPLIDDLVQKTILQKNDSYECENCEDGTICVDSDGKEGTCMNCNETFNLDDLQPKYDYIRGSKYKEIETYQK